jgi:hypothetical protein
VHTKLSIDDEETQQLGGSREKSIDQIHRCRHAIRDSRKPRRRRSRSSRRTEKPETGYDTGTKGFEASKKKRKKK